MELIPSENLKERSISLERLKTFIFTIGILWISTMLTNYLYMDEAESIFTCSLVLKVTKSVQQYIYVYIWNVTYSSLHEMTAG